MSYSFGLSAASARLLLPACFCLALPFLDIVAVRTQSGIDTTGTGGRHTIQGRIYAPSGERTYARIKVKLESYNSGELSLLSDPNGTFRFTSLNPGSYMVVVDAGDEYELAREPVYIDTDGSNDRRGFSLPPLSRTYTVQFNLQMKRAEAIKAGVVNAVLAGIPAGARDLYQKALAAARTGDSKMAIQTLQSALAIYPKFPLALNELGVQFLKIGQADKAEQALAAAVKLAPEDFLPRLNYGFALLNQKKFAQAEEQLRVAVKRNNAIATAHLYLGMTLAVQRKLDEAEKELLIAININGNEMGRAHRYLGGIYLERHENKRAADEFEVYLKLVPNAADASVMVRKIRELRGKS